VLGLRRWRALSPALAVEVRDGPSWMYPWPLAKEPLPLVSDELPEIHATRLEMLEPLARPLVQRARVLDIACHEGWFAHRMVDWGAREVIGVDVREINIRRADLLRRHFGIAERRLRFIQANVYDLTPEALGRFDVVLMLGLIYHLENPIGAIRVARALTSNVCFLESQLTQQVEPIRFGWGVAGSFEEEAASWAARFESPEEQEHQPLAAHGGVISLIPNAAAVEQGMAVAGFRDVRRLSATAGHNVQYVEGDRGVFVGRA
jgi:tRNA (mo5U34)-methyltransferase